MKQYLLTTAFVVLGYICGAQQFTKETITATDKLIKPESDNAGMPVRGTFLGFSNPPSMDVTWQPMLQRVVSENESEDNELLERIKEQKNKLKEINAATPLYGSAKTTSVTPPVLGTNFTGIDNGGGYTPLDNTLAISNKDTIVAFVNSEIAYYTAAGVRTYIHDIYSMINDVTIVNSLCDPKVIYDNVARRFIFYIQVCLVPPDPTKSFIILGFSKTSNPADGWYYYKFTGNPLSNGDWWDYPKMGISTNDLFVTGNLFNGTTFDQSGIYQIQKAPCYAGSALTSSNSKFYNVPHFTVLPLSYGQSGSYGPGIYLLSTEGGTGGSTSMKFFNITNSIASGSALLQTYNVTTTPFSTAGDALQSGTTKSINTGDSRSQDGFYLHGYAHFVFNVDAGGGYCGFTYARIKVSTLTYSSSVKGNVSTSEYCYPAIASASNDSNDQSVIIAYHESGSGMFPRTCAIKCDQSFNWSTPLTVKAGASYVTVGTTATERWGDYTGLAKRYGDPTNSLWMAGMYGNTSHYWSQWIAKLNAFPVGVGAISKEETTTRVYPNPIADIYHVKFDLSERQHIIINITDMEGRTVVALYNGIAEAGENLFTFNKSNLATGVYSLNILGTNANIRNEKIVVTGK
jgi:hypothetical protein